MTTQASFFSNVASFATPFVKTNAVVSKDPLVQAKSKFARIADEQIKLIKAASDKGFWFKKHGEGYVLTLKNGAAAINKEQPCFAVGTAADAVKFLEQAKSACAAGEFDGLFVATARAPRKPKEAAAASAQPAVEPSAATPQSAPAAKKAAKK